MLPTDSYILEQTKLSRKINQSYFFTIICPPIFKKLILNLAGQLREIIAELDPRLTEEDLDGIIEEIDEDGSGTMDFDEFCQMMMS